MSYLKLVLCISLTFDITECLLNIIIHLQAGWSALTLASQNEQVDVVDTLLQRGASVDLQNTVSVIIYSMLKSVYTRCNYVPFLMHPV